MLPRHARRSLSTTELRSHGSQARFQPCFLHQSESSLPPCQATLVTQYLTSAAVEHSVISQFGASVGGERIVFRAALIAMKFTQYFTHLRQRPDRACIKLEWIQQAIAHPIRTEVQSDGRIRKWTRVKELDKILRVILLEDGETVHNAFFDRSFKE
jgi:predicted ATPase